MHKTSTGAESQTSGRSYRHKFVFIFLPSSFIYVWKVKCLRDTGVPKGNAHFFVITTTPPRPLSAPLGLTTPEELPRTSGSPWLEPSSKPSGQAGLSGERHCSMAPPFRCRTRNETLLSSHCLHNHDEQGMERLLWAPWGYVFPLMHGNCLIANHLFYYY